VQLDGNRITIRERSYVDILDLSLRVIRELANPLVPIFFAGVLPMMVLNGWLLSGYEQEDFELGFPLSHMLWMTLLVLFEAPLATAPATLYLGRAMFAERLSFRGVLGELRQSLPQLLILQVLLRPLFFRWTYLNEVILLDRNPMWQKGPQGKTTVSRARTVHRGEGGDLFGRWFLSLALGALLVMVWWGSLVILRIMLGGRLEYDRAMFTFDLPVSLWIVVCYFTVVRFLGYLDLRIRREGWKVELAMRAERARLTRRWG